MRWLVLAVLGTGCGPNDPIDITKDSHSSHAGRLDGGSDASTGSDAAGDGNLLRDLGANADLALRPTSAQCFMGWPSLGGACAAPIITSAGKTSDCDGTLGWEIVGGNFEFARDNSAQHLADTGPELWGDDPGVMGKLSDSWNVLTTTRLCITSSQTGPPASHVFVVNPDGQRSNTVSYKF